MTNTAWGQQPDRVVSIGETKLKKLLKIYSVSAFIFLGDRHIIKFYDDVTPGQRLLRSGDERISYINGFCIYRGIFRIVI